MPAAGACGQEQRERIMPARRPLVAKLILAVAAIGAVAVAAAPSLRPMTAEVSPVSATRATNRQWPPAISVPISR